GRPAQCELLALLARQRLRHEQKAVKPVEEAKTGSDPKWKPRAEITEWTAHRWPQNETQTKGHSDHSKRTRALLSWNNISDVGHCRWNTGGRNSGNNPAEKEPAQCRRKRHHHVIETEAKIREQDHRSPAKAIRQDTEN